ncbi:MAG TPA: hypothetical protein VFF27_16405, partial [Bacteroidia bacterium]|nr:hypothetical protein [Bacteroidia bacterium]
MIKILRISLVLSLALAFNTVFAQTKKDTVLLLSGGIVTGTITEVAPAFLVVKESEKSSLTIEMERVFSYTNASGEHIVYAVDSLNGNEFSVT